MADVAAIMIKELVREVASMRKELDRALMLNCRHLEQQTIIHATDDCDSTRWCPQCGALFSPYLSGSKQPRHPAWSTRHVWLKPHPDRHGVRRMRRVP